MAAYCEAPGPTLPGVECDCPRPFTVSPDPACRKCGKVPWPSERFVSFPICLKKLGHRGAHSWDTPAERRARVAP